MGSWLLIAILASNFAIAAQDTYTLEAGKWQQQEQADPDSPEGQLQTIRRSLAEDQAKLAETSATTWIENHPNHPQLAEAHLLRGDALAAQQHYFKSLFDYEHVIQVYPGSVQFNTALEREYEIAKLFHNGMRRRFLGMRILSGDPEAEEILIRIQERSPGSKTAERASLTLGDFYFKRSQMNNASQAMRLFLSNYPDSRFRERAILRLIQSHLATFRGPKFDATGLLEAEYWLKQLEKEFPVSAGRLGAQALRIRVDESLALKTYYAGQWYERVDQHVSAVYIYQKLIEDHPQTVAAQAAMQRLQALQAPGDYQSEPGDPDIVPVNAKSLKL